MIIALLAPAVEIPKHLFRTFLATSTRLFFVTNIIFCIFLVSVVLPMIGQGRTLGQALFGIEVVYTKESEAGGVFMSLMCRAIGIAVISLAPGWTVRWLGASRGYITEFWQASVVIIVMAAISWIVVYIITLVRADDRSLIDYFSGTRQIEGDEPPPEDMTAALLPLALGFGLLFVIGILIPVILNFLDG
jgi:hypothetical protein